MTPAPRPPLWHYVLPDTRAAGRYVTAVRVCGAECFAALESFPTAGAAQAAADSYNATLPQPAGLEREELAA